MADSPWQAARSIKHGDGWLSTGDPVPVEAGRDYGLMHRLGDIHPAGGSPEDAMTKTSEQLAANAVEAEKEAGDKGLVPSNPPVPDVEEALAGHQDLDHAGTDAPTREQAGDLAKAREGERQAAEEIENPPTADEQVTRRGPGRPRKL